MAEEASAPKRLEIKKYPNRRYYDATRSRHVTLEEINSLIRDGYEIQVTDSKTGQDITGKVLTQLILELDAPKLDAFPVPLLHRLIRANQQWVTEFIEKYFNQTLATFLDSQRSFEQSMRQAMGLHPSLPGVQDWAKLMWGPLAPSFMGGQRRSEPAPPAPETPKAEEPEGSNGHGTPSSNGSDVRQVVEELRQQVAALQEQLAEQKGAKRKRPGQK